MQDRLDLTFSALADPTRRAILARLALGDATVSELMQPFPMSQPAVSKHLKVLERAGLISRGRNGQFQPRRLETERLKEAASWVTQFRAFWEGSFDRLDDYLAATLAQDRLTEDRQSRHQPVESTKETP